MKKRSLSQCIEADGAGTSPAKKPNEDTRPIYLCAKVTEEVK
jgi:hypothetical protein